MAIRNIAAGIAALFAAAPLLAATYSIEPDDHVGDISHAAPQARLITLRHNAAHDGFSHHPVLSVEGGSWAPTGSRVFGHAATFPGELGYHWDNLGWLGAWDCYVYGPVCGEFKVFSAVFREPASSVKILTTMRGEMAMDPVELWAFDSDGQVLLRCHQQGVVGEVLQTGVLPPPHYYTHGIPIRARKDCGAVIEVRDCGEGNTDPGSCNYVVEMRVERKKADIAFVWFGGKLWMNTHANVDLLTYTIP